MALNEDLEQEAREKQESTQFQKGFTVTSELKCPRQETDKESQDRRNKNRTNTKLANLAEVSPAKVFRYKEIVEHGTPEEIEAVDSGKAKICPTYDKIKARERVELAQTEFLQDLFIAGHKSLNCIDHS